MANNQALFNQEHLQEVKKIKIVYEEFEGDLLIENYPHLEKLYLLETKSIDKITLKNLTQLQECTIWNCGVKDLTFENCPQIKKLNVRSNSLTNLEFLKNLEKLEKLEIDDNIEIALGLEHLPDGLEIFSHENTKLTEFLKQSYSGDWRVYRKDIQELIELTEQNPQELLKNIRDLKKEIKKLKNNQLVTIDNPNDFEKKYQKLKGTLNFLIKEEELKSKEIDSLVTDELVESIKEQKEDLSNLQKTKKELEAKLVAFEQLYQTKKEKIEQKEKELEELENTCLEKAKNYEKAQEKLSELLECQAELIVNNSEYIHKRKNGISEKLIQKAKLTIEELDELCQLQSRITQLKLEIQKNFNQVNQVFNIKGNVSQSIIGVANSSIHDIDMSSNITSEKEVNEAIALQVFPAK